MGIVFLVATYGVYHPPIIYSMILLIPMLMDGGIQLLTKYESNNSLRFFTGLLFGYALFSLIVSSMIGTYWYGYHFF